MGETTCPIFLYSQAWAGVGGTVTGAGDSLLRHSLRTFFLRNWRRVGPETKQVRIIQYDECHEGPVLGVWE